MEGPFPARVLPSTRAFAQLSLIAFLALALCCPRTFAQSGAGSIQGTITDSTGAIVVGATIHVVNQATGVATDSKTNSVGFYQVPGLFTGTYIVSISAEGMQTNQQTIELLVGQNAVINSTLSPGAVTQKVEVEANAVQLVNTTDGTISATLENQRINQLPMNGRNIISLVNETTPGLESCPESGSCANGLSGPALEYETDGVTLANREFGGVHEGSIQMVDPDAVQEVRVEDEASGANFAAPATAIINTKSGTNRFHGSLFETARNNAFGIARNRQEQSNYVAPEYIRNEFGASIGGPIIIPHLYNGKNKSFFFFAYERYSLAQIVSQNESTPTVAMRSGDFSGLVNSSNVLQQLYDPTTTAASANCNGAGANSYCRAPFGNNPTSGAPNYIPQSRESPTAAVLNAMTPLPTNNNNPLVKSNLSGLVRELQVEPQITFRLDQNFDQNNHAYLRYTQNLSTSTTPRNDPVDESYTLQATTPSGVVIPAGASGIAYDPDALFAAALGYTHVFSSTFSSETILSQQWMGEQNYAGGSPFTDFESELGLPNNFGEVGFPYVESIFQPMDGTQFQYGMTDRILQFDENLTKTMGNHEFLFGGRYRFEHFGSRPDESKDSINFNGMATGLYNPATGSPITGSPAAFANSGQLNADEFLGSASTYSVNLEPPYQHFHDNEFDLYFQDNYRVRKNLTLNLGLRYEAHPAAWEGQGAMMGFDLKNDAMVTSGSIQQLISEGLTTQAIINNDQLDGAKFETPQQAGLPPMLVNSYDFTWGPRVGVAWQPFTRTGTVLRGGLGRYIYPNPIREAYRDVNRNNPFTAGYTEDYTNITYAPTKAYLLLSSPTSSSGYNYSTTLAGGGTPIMGVNTTGAINTNSANAIAPGLSIVSLDPVFPPSAVEEANVTIEQPLKWNSVVRVSYIYTHGTDLNNSFYYNDHPSTYSWEVSTGTATPSSSAIGPQNTNTGEGPYDQVTYGGSSYQIQKSGWSNYNGLQAVFQKLYHNGSAWQVLYVWSKSMRTGDDFGGESGDNVLPYSSFANTAAPGVTYAPLGGIYFTPTYITPPNLPPPPPAGTPSWGYYKALNRWENYMVDPNNPPQHLQFNGIIDLPFGRGKRWLGNANRALDEAVGGWQLAGAGRVQVTNFPITTTNWGPTNPLKVYKHGAPITDCRSGTCLKSYEWWNGYIAPTAIQGNACAGSLSTVVEGLPGNWQPYLKPIDYAGCSTPANGKVVVDQYFGENEIAINGVTGLKANTAIGYGVVPGNNDNGASESTIDVTNPYGHTVLQGPWNWSADLSVFKVFPITESILLRVNVDAFNVFNIQGLPNPSGSDGTVCYTPGGQGCSSYNTPRQLQLTARLTF